MRLRWFDERDPCLDALTDITMAVRLSSLLHGIFSYPYVKDCL
jgi:hypothetical protein